jgi:threonine synthase
MAGFAKNKSLTVELNADGVMDPLFAAGEADTAQTLAMIKKCYEQEGYILDPHTAVGVVVSECFADMAAPTICLATAHPAKFNDAIQQAIGVTAHHPALDKLADAETRCDTIANDESAIRDYLIRNTV